MRVNHKRLHRVYKHMGLSIRLKKKEECLLVCRFPYRYTKDSPIPGVLTLWATRWAMVLSFVLCMYWMLTIGRPYLLKQIIHSRAVGWYGCSTTWSTATVNHSVFAWTTDRGVYSQKAACLGRTAQHRIALHLTGQTHTECLYRTVQQNVSGTGIGLRIGLIASIRSGRSHSYG